MEAVLKIPNFSNYEIYPKDGLVWSLKTNKFVGAKNLDGYYQCRLFGDDGTEWFALVHRVVYTACYGEIPEGMQVNHINEIKTDNRIDNLNLMSSKENCNWGNRNKILSRVLTNNKKKSKKVGAYKDGKLVMVFPSTMEASRNGFSNGNISRCCKGELKHHKGFQWKYLS